MKKIALTLLLLVITISYTNAQNKYGMLTYNKAVNISGKQRMLGQKIAKIYVYLANNPNDAKAKRDLITSKIIFEKQNDILAKNTSSNITKARLKEVENIWEKFSKILNNDPNAEDAKKIVRTNTLLLKASNSVVTSIIIESKKTGSSEESAEEDLELKKTINLSGKQRMLSQRLGLYYLANQGATKSPMTEKTLNTVFEDLDNAISDLLISNYNTDKIEEALANAMGIWSEIRENKKKLLNQGFDNTKIYKLSNELTKAFNKVTSLYERTKL